MSDNNPVAPLNPFNIEISDITREPQNIARAPKIDIPFSAPSVPDLAEQAKQVLREHGGPGGDPAGAGCARRTLESRIAQNQYRSHLEFSKPELALETGKGGEHESR